MNSQQILRQFNSIIIVSALYLLSSCTESPYFELTGTRQERITQVVKHFNLPADKKSALISSMLDAHLFEERKGSGDGFGPADYCRYFALSVQPQTMNTWRSVLASTPILQLENRHYPAPAQPTAWWLSESNYHKLTMYEANALTGLNGWVGVENSGQIYIYICTT